MTQSNTETFEHLLLGFARPYDLHQVFEDFLNVGLATLDYIIEYDTLPEVEIVDPSFAARYREADFLIILMGLLRHLSDEMQDRERNGLNPDILGEFYEQHLADPNDEPVFMPWGKFTFNISEAGGVQFNPANSYGFFDNNCMSGRRLMAMIEILGTGNYYFGMDRNPLFVKMAAINLFMGTKAKGEVVCIQPEDPAVFRLGYRYSQYPPILKPIEETESHIWLKMRAQW